MACGMPWDRQWTLPKLPFSKKTKNNNRFLKTGLVIDLETKGLIKCQIVVELKLYLYKFLQINIIF